MTVSLLPPSPAAFAKATWGDVAPYFDDLAARSLEPGVTAPSRPGYPSFLERFEPAYRAELLAFLAAVSTSAESPCPVTDARQALAVALAADRSCREHRPVRVEEVG